MLRPTGQQYGNLDDIEGIPKHPKKHHKKSHLCIASNSPTGCEFK